MGRNDDESNLQIQAISAKHLWPFNFFQKLCVYAAVSISGASDSGLQLSKAQMQEQRTPTDLTGDGHPEWNHSLSFQLLGLPSLSDLFIHFDLRHHAGLLFPDRTIGEVRVPLSDLLDSPGSLRFVDYQVRSPDGKPNGSLRFSYVLNQSAGDSPVEISGYPRISDQSEGASSLYPAVELWDTTSAQSSVPQDHEARPEVSHTHPPAEDRPEVSQTYPPAEPALMPQYPPTPMWPPPPPPPPYWAPPPGFMYHPPPPPPPPGYFHHPWDYQRTTASQQNTGR